MTARIVPTLKTDKGFTPKISEKTDTVFREITTGKVTQRLEKAALLKALRIERDRPNTPTAPVLIPPHPPVLADVCKERNGRRVQCRRNAPRGFISHGRRSWRSRLFVFSLLKFLAKRRIFGNRGKLGLYLALD